MKLKVLVTALALLASTAVASANDTSWFSLVGGGTLVSQGPGQTLVIEKPLGPGTTVLTIGYNFSNNKQFGNPQGMAGWQYDLDAAAGVSYGGYNFPLSTGANYDVVLNNASGATSNVGGASSAANGLDGNVFQFTITIVKDGTGGSTNIFGGLLTQVPNGPFAWFGAFGPNANQYGIPNYAGGPFGGNNRNLPVITINNVPEPATIVLLGMGVVALIRRRR